MLRAHEPTHVSSTTTSVRTLALKFATSQHSTSPSPVSSLLSNSNRRPSIPIPTPIRLTKLEKIERTVPLTINTKTEGIGPVLPVSNPDDTTTAVTATTPSSPNVKALKELWEGRSGRTGTNTRRKSSVVAVAVAAEQSAMVDVENVVELEGQTRGTTVKNDHGCASDMIVCGIRSFTVDGTKLHEIELSCHGCASSFVLRAAHDCGVTDGTDGFTLPISRDKGLEWLRGDRADYINIAC
ncbi:hypothetical protein HKX48_001171 [Thoreauomyces humboldtii]|nr:hypothetical protein HKX48_001171 [Thoreauomyces humboldtii]